MANFGDIIKSPLFLMKVIELILSILSTGLVSDVGLFTLDSNKIGLVYGTLIGFLMINIIIIAAIVFDTPLGKNTILLITIPAGILLLAAGGIMIDEWNSPVLPIVKVSDNVVGAGVVAILNGILYIVDAIITFFKHAS